MIGIIERELGRKLEITDRHSVSTLNDISETMLGELRRISPDAVNTYLRFHLREGSETAFEDFTRDVIRGGSDPMTWGFRDVVALVRETRRGAALTMSVDELRATLANVAGERWVRYSVADACQVNRSLEDSAWGAPGVLVRHAPYWWTPPRTEIMAHLGSSQIATVSDDGLVIAFRRWVALRAWRWAQNKGIELSAASPRQVADAIGIDWGRVSADGVAALSALIREAQGPFDPETNVRGYVAPDEWYAA